MSGVEYFFTIISFLGAILICVFSIPQLYTVFKTKNTSIVHTKTTFLLASASFLLSLSSLYFFGQGMASGTGGDSNTWFSFAIGLANVVSFTNATILIIYKKIKESNNKNKTESISK